MNDQNSVNINQTQMNIVFSIIFLLYVEGSMLICSLTPWHCGFSDCGWRRRLWIWRVSEYNE